MSELQNLLPALQANRQPPVSISQIHLFLTIASQLKNEILLVQPGNFDLAGPVRPLLSPSIQAFLAEACGIPDASINIIWKYLARSVCTTDPNILSLPGATPHLPSLYAISGHPKGITYRSLFPPSQKCMNRRCKRYRHLMLKKAESRQAVLFTQNDGPVPIFSVHLSCEDCRVNYHHNYRVFQDQRIYYDGIPEILQIGEHQFAERKLVGLWISMMLLSWTSATNCARIYNTMFHQSIPIEWKFSLQVTSDQVYDAFTILSLLEDCKSQNSTLVVPNGGLAKDRFTEAVRLRNDRFRLCSQPELFHHCKRCTRYYPNRTLLPGMPIPPVWPPPIEHKVSVVVIDGVTVGHPCCGEPNCKNALENNHERFCPGHNFRSKVCAIVGCFSSVVSGRRTCGLSEHQAIENVYDSRGQGRFQLKERQRRAQVAHPPDSLAVEVTDISELVEDDNMEEPFEFNGRGEARPAAELESTGRRPLRAQFGRKRTHNEQLFVAPCGIIMARETFYHAEAVSSVVEMIKRTYRLPQTKPNHIFFDNNCTLAKHVKDDPFFRDIALTVDVFHFTCKHSKEDRFCRENCDPSAYPELRGEGNKRWYFNSSIAEQTNSWLGGYHAICREMRVDRYNFFLDEMIRRRNLMTLAKLVRDGSEPDTWPYVP